MIPYTPPRVVTELPVIDLGSAGCAADMRKACIDTGFFYVVNHGVAEATVEAAFLASRALFALPQAEKLALLQAKSPAKRGYEPPGTQVLDDGSPADHKESFRYGPDPGPSHPYALRRLPTYGPSQWPASLPGIVSPLMAYIGAVTSLGNRILVGLAESLDLPPDYFLAFYGQPMATVRLLRYPPQPAVGSNLLGAGAHTDWGGITLLAQDDVGGLEVRNVAGDWIAGPPLKGSFVINIGEMMARWTNGRYQSNMHRVRNNSGAVDRYSMACFYDPEYDSRIECLPSCLVQGEAPTHPPCTAGEHIAQMHAHTTGARTASPASPSLTRQVP